MRASGRFPVVTWRARRVRFMADAERGAVERALAELGIEGTLLEARASFEDAFLFLAREAKGGPGGVLPGSTG